MGQVYATVPIWREYTHGIDRKLSKAENPNPAILSGGSRGADIAGQEHLEYPPDTYILSLMSGAMLVIKLFF